MIHPVQPHGSDSEQPHCFGLPLPKIPLNNCPVQSAVKNSGLGFFFSPPSPAKPGLEGMRAARRDHAPARMLGTGKAGTAPWEPRDQRERRRSPKKGDKWDAIPGVRDGCLPRTSREARRKIPGAGCNLKGATVICG